MNGLFWFGIVFTLAAPILIGVLVGDTSMSWLAALCGAFVTFMSRMESLTEVSLGPVKAKLRVTLAEAAATIAQLRKVAAATAEASLTDLMAGGFMGGMTLEKRLELHDKLVATLKVIGASKDEIAQARSAWNKGIALIYHRAIKTAVEERKSPNQINPAATDQQRSAGGELEELLDFDTWTVPTPAQIRSVLSRHSIRSEAVDAWLDDYEHYLKTDEIRRRDAFVKQ